MQIDNELVRAELDENGFAYIRNMDENSPRQGGVVTFCVNGERARKRLMKAWAMSEQNFSALWKASSNAGFNPTFRSY